MYPALDSPASIAWEVGWSMRPIECCVMASFMPCGWRPPILTIWGSIGSGKRGYWNTPPPRILRLVSNTSIPSAEF